jgi:hypothetical protein
MIISPWKGSGEGGKKNLLLALLILITEKEGLP